MNFIFPRAVADESFLQVICVLAKSGRTLPASPFTTASHTCRLHARRHYITETCSAPITESIVHSVSQHKGIKSNSDIITRKNK